MQVVGSYGVRIRDDYDALKRTADLFSNAVSYLVHPALENWEALCEANSLQRRQRMLECMIHSSDGFSSSDFFDQRFPKSPSYYRRAAITHPLGGIVSAYRPLFLHSHSSFSEYPKCWHSITDPCKAFVLL